MTLLHSLLTLDALNFGSLDFLFWCLPAFLAAYYLAPAAYRNAVLFAGSILLYALAQPHFVLVLLASCAVNFWLGARLSSKPYFIAAILLDVLLLASCKAAVLAGLCKALPVGVSFFTFKLISYQADVRRGVIPPESSFLRFAAYVSFFPQIIQGPIPRYNQLAPQLEKGHSFDERTFVKGFLLILWGFFLKLCIADKASVIVNTVFDQFPTYQGTYFLACTSFAQGFAELVGIELVNNFQRPYFSKSIKEFWRRWHISLSSWLKDYVYIPLGGNRKGIARKYLNLLLTFAVSGIWHGAGYKYVFWGLLHGVYQIVGEVLRPIKQLLSRKLHMQEHSCCQAVCQQGCTFILVMLAWIIFRADSLGTGLAMIRSIFTVPNLWILTNDALFSLGLGWKECMVLVICLLVLLSAGFLQEKGIAIREKILCAPLAARWSVYIGAILFVMLFGTYGYGFDAQAFIYGGF